MKKKKKILTKNRPKTQHVHIVRKNATLLKIPTKERAPFANTARKNLINMIKYSIATVKQNMISALTAQ